MSKIKSLSIAVTGLSALTLSNVQAFADISDIDTPTVDVDKNALAQAQHAGCEEPANRDYHDILAGFDGGKDGEYKFTGCGTAI